MGSIIVTQDGICNVKIINAVTLEQLVASSRVLGR